MFIRFVVDDLDRNSGKRQGLFQAAYRLQGSGILKTEDGERVARLCLWFSRNLGRPKRLAISSRPHAREQALCWFKDSAIEHIAKMREFTDVTERYGMPVEMIKAQRAGYIVYEDQFQVAAYPFRDTPT